MNAISNPLTLQKNRLFSCKQEHVRAKTIWRPIGAGNYTSESGGSFELFQEIAAYPAN